MKKLKSGICLILLFIGLMGLAVADEYAYTTAYFYIPSDISFGVFLLGTAVNVTSLESPPGASTTWISFNASTGTEYDVQPMTEGTTTNKQDGPTRPIARIYNMGNTNFYFYMNASVGQACIDVCANSTCGGTGCNAQPACNSIKELPLSWATLSTNVPTDGYLNITMYADFVTCTPPLYQQGEIYYRSSLS